MEGHKALVTSVIVVPASSPANKVLCFCWTASLDGSIRYWDFSVPELMKTIDIKMPIYSMVSGLKFFVIDFRLIAEKILFPDFVSISELCVFYIWCLYGLGKIRAM